MQIYLLILLVYVFFLDLAIFKTDIICPAIIFTFTFLVCVICACINTSNWNLDLAEKTCGIIFLGVFMFSLGAIVVRMYKNRYRKYVSTYEDIQPVKIKDGALIIFLFFQIFIRFFQMFIMKKNAGGTNVLSEIIKINHYHDINGVLDYSSPVVDFGNIICNSAGYLFMYVFICNRFLKKKNTLLLWINLIFSLVGSMLAGHRTDMFAIIISGFAMFFILVNRRRGWRKKFNVKAAIIIVVSVFLFLLSFQQIGILLGRGGDINYWDYIFTYIGAQIKNLDIFVRTETAKSMIWGRETFGQLYGFFDNYFGTTLTAQKISRASYNFINGHPLGNVYTTFRPFYIDFGLIGVALISFFMGFVSEVTYEWVISKKHRKQNIDFSVVIYSYLVFAIAFSFFSNKFFEVYISIRMLYYGIGMYLCNFLFFRIGFDGTKITIKKSGRIRIKWSGERFR